MMASDELKAILDRIATGKHTKADITVLRDALNFSGDQIVLQWGEDNINIGNIGQARNITIGNNTYQNADAEQIKLVLCSIIEEHKKYPITIKTSNIFVESLLNYIEYEIGDKQRRIIQLLVLALVINIVTTLALTLLKISNLYTQNSELLSFFIFTSLILAILLPLIFKSFRKGTFWKNLPANDKKIVSDYLSEIKILIYEKLEFYFDPENHHVALSGIENAYSHQAYEEKAPSIRKHIRNLDTYLLSPINKRIFIYGPPGSGKSTTLYKTFLNYQARIKSQKLDHIPIFIHANQIANLIKTNEYIPEKVYDFVENIYQKESTYIFRDFIELLRRRQEIKLVIIVDALDEFVDKTKRRKLFDYLSTLIKNTSLGGTKWILSCREEEYKAYSDRLDVANVRIQPMNLHQIQELLRKRLKSLDLNYGERANIRRTILEIAKAEGQNETFLKNPYYLTLWLWQITYSPNRTDPNIPSIDELHFVEIKREIAKSKNKNPRTYGSISDNLVSNIIKVLSILSFYILQFSLKKEVHQGLSLNNIHILKFLTKVLLPINLNDQDEITKRRIKEYSDTLKNTHDLRATTSEDNEFVDLINAIQYTIFKNINQLSLGNKEEGIAFLIIISSLITQSYETRLIDCNIRQALLLGFFNQRAADYLVACHLKNVGLTGILKTNDINFWLFRAIAIAIAISERPQDILKFENLPRDRVFETAIGNGLTLITSERKKEIKLFLNEFINHLMNKERLFSKNYDPCDPLRVLREVRRLCLNGYSEYMNLSSKVHVQAFSKLLKHQDAGISEMAMETLLTYACQISFRYDLWLIILRHLVQKSLRLEFGFLNSLIKFWHAIKEVEK